ncbi:helix-turn-helix domain-containing protein [Deinococcus ficus]|nr:helix-turn-helix domain-containing protein [Deinococcus ficus]
MCKTRTRQAPPGSPDTPPLPKNSPDPEPTTPLLLTVPQTAKLLQLGLNRVYEMCRTGELPTVNVGKQVRIPRQALERWANPTQ